ncbi:hypothetical protein JGU66_34905 [Myxococcaceae bacterium JPH2]|nr:hypothetical protein [Myxococcaceae bacterium JPH2]
MFYLVNGRVLVIGSNRAGQLGVGHANPYNQVPPVDIALPAELRFKDVAGGGFQSVALDVQGRVWTLGQNRYGQRGDGTTNDYPNRTTTPNSSQPLWLPEIRVQCHACVSERVISCTVPVSVKVVVA